MKEELQRITIENSRKFLNKIDAKISGEWKYKCFYKFINHSLKYDFAVTDKMFYKETKKVRNIVSEKIPNKYWVMWWQGLDDIHTPLLIINNIRNLQKLFGEENVIIITKNNYEKYTNISDNMKSKLKNKKISFTHWSDIVRFNILNSRGGIWIDSTVVISPKFKEFIKSHQINKFITICENSMDYHNISFSQWTTWFIGGIPNYDLFEYVCIFYDNYFKIHDKIIDYFLLDDIIAHYYQKNLKFREDCKKNEGNWQPYYWIRNFQNKYSNVMEKKYNFNINYSIQKLTYKFDSNILADSESLAFHILNKNYSEIG